jgi:hypothetical protein
MRHAQSLWLAVLVLCTSAPGVEGDAARPPEIRSSAARDNPLAVWPLELLSDTRERPLFSPRRRPPPAPLPVAQVVEAEPELPPPNIILIAIVREGGVAQAVVRTAEAENAIRARLGDEIAGWKVTQIETLRLMLSSGNRSVGFALFAGMDGKGTVSRGGAPTSPDVAQNVAQERTNRRTGHH